MMIPKQQSLSVPGREILYDATGVQVGPSVLIDGSVVTDAGSTPTSLLRPGLVLLQKSATKKFYLATDTTNGTLSSQATVSSTIAIGAGAASKTFIWTYKGGASQTVTTGAGDNTAALVATALNANVGFAADLVASNSGSTLIITAKRAGADEWFTIVNGTINNQGGGGGSDTFTNNTTYAGSNGEYHVLAEYVQLTDFAGAATDAIARTYRSGKFKKTQLIGLTADAEWILRQRGAQFV